MPSLTPRQAQWVRDYYTGWNTTFREFTGPLVWFQIRDSGTNLGDKWQNLGLLRRDRTPKPAYAEFRAVATGGVAWTPPDLTGVTVPQPGVRVSTNPRGGYYTLQSDGAVRSFDGAPYYGSPALPRGLARGLLVAPDGHGYLVLDAYGGLHKFGSASRGALGCRRGSLLAGLGDCP